MTFEQDGPVDVSEIGDVEKNNFLEALNSMPSEGIALRGDQNTRAKILKEKGLVEGQINYIVFRPPELRPKVWGKDAEDLYGELKSAIDMALVYSDPWQDTGAFSRISDVDFVDFKEYFSNNPEQLPAITWFVEAGENQFKRVLERGRLWYHDKYEHHTGDVDTFGTVPSDKLRPTILLDEEDISLAQELIMEKNTKADWRTKRRELRDELGKIAASKLMSAMIQSFT